VLSFNLVGDHRCGHSPDPRQGALEAEAPLLSVENVAGRSCRTPRGKSCARWDHVNLTVGRRTGHFGVGRRIRLAGKTIAVVGDPAICCRKKQKLLPAG